MAYYFIANIKIHDEREYQNYLDGVDEVFSRYNGTYLALDKQPEILEGEWEYDRTALIRFKSKEDFLDWYRSEDYQEILKFRLKAAHCDTILVKGP